MSKGLLGFLFPQVKVGSRYMESKRNPFDEIDSYALVEEVKDGYVKYSLHAIPNKSTLPQPPFKDVVKIRDFLLFYPEQYGESK